MALEKFDASAIATIDNGRIAEALNQAIARAQQDCADRPGLEKARTVNLTIEIVPVMGESDLDSCFVGFRITEKLPGRESKRFNMVPTRDGLKFNELSPEEADQLTIDQEEGPRLKEGAAPKKKESKSNAG